MSPKHRPSPRSSTPRDPGAGSGAGPPARTIPLWQRLLLLVVSTALFLGLIELALGLAGFRPKLYDEDPYVGFSSVLPLFARQEAPGGGAVWRTAPGKLRLFNDQSFPTGKAAGTYRIFCVGGSTTYGRPYDDRTSFCGWLREMLPVADPSRRWEVVNAGGVSYASYRVALLMEELAGYEPDLFVIYSGHNEFLESRTYEHILATPRAVRGLGALAAHTRLYAALDDAFARLRKAGAEPAGERSVLEAEVGTATELAVGPSAYERDPEQRRAILEHYRFNLARMVDIARSAGAGAILVEPAANLRHQSPFRSQHGDGVAPADAQRCEAAVAAARSALAANDPDAAERAILEALDIDDRWADGHFVAGRMFYREGRPREARAAYERALVEDVCPLRAAPDMLEIVADVAADREAPLVHFARWAEDHSPDGIPGEELFLDHVHPTIAAHRELAALLVEEMVAEGIVRPVAGWGPEAVEQIADRIESGLDRRDHARALSNLSKVMAWAGKLEEARRHAARAVELFPEDGMVRYQAGLTADLAGDYEAAEAHYRRAVELTPQADVAQGNLAIVLERRGALAEAVEHHRLALAHATDESRERHRANLANALRLRGLQAYDGDDYATARASLEEARRLRRDDLEILWALGSVYTTTGAAEATVLYREILELDPSNAAAQNRLALALAAGGDLDGALEAYRRAVELDPTWADHPESLSSYLRFRGETEAARRAEQAAGR